MPHHCPLESRDSNEKSKVDSFFVLILFSCAGQVFFVLVWVKTFYSGQPFCSPLSTSLSLYDIFLKTLWLCLPCHQSSKTCHDPVHYPSTPRCCAHFPPYFGPFLIPCKHIFLAPSLTLLYLVGKLKPSLNSITNTLCPSTQTAEHC